MKKIEVKKFYNELNEMNDVSGDYVEVTMPTDLWIEVKIAVWRASRDDKRFKNLYEVLDKETNYGKSEWYK